MRIILASQSPRRVKVLKEIGVEFETIPSNFDENSVKEKKPLKLVKILALEKARIIAKQNPSSLVIGADTIVLIDGQITGKPKNLAQARKMVLKSAGKVIEDATGIAVIYKGQELSASMVGKAKLRNYSDAEVDKYLKEANPLDKAGGFAADPAEGGRFLISYEGEPGQELGLPKITLTKFLHEFGVKILAGKN